jgi:hypothetical protein
MNPSTALTGGLVGACAVTLLHETVKRVVPESPRMDLLGMNALSKGLKKAGMEQPDSRTLFTVALVGDLVSNALYYSLAGIGKNNQTLVRGTLLGLAAGLGAVFLPKPLGLNDKYSNRTVATQLMTIGLYVTGALVTASVIKMLEKKKRKRNADWEERLTTSAIM